MHPPTLKFGSSIYHPSLFFKSNKKSAYKYFANRKAKKRVDLCEGEKQLLTKDAWKAKMFDQDL